MTKTSGNSFELRPLRERVRDLARRPPNAHLTAEDGGLRRDPERLAETMGRKDVRLCRTLGRSDRLRRWS
jgi:hypothetical protein